MFTGIGALYHLYPNIALTILYGAPILLILKEREVNVWTIGALMDILHGVVHIIWPFLHPVYGFQRHEDPSVDIAVLHFSQGLLWLYYSRKYPERRIIGDKLHVLLLVGNMAAAVFGSCMTLYPDSICSPGFDWTSIFPALMSAGYVATFLSFPFSHEKSRKMKLGAMILTMVNWVLFKRYMFYTELAASSRFFEAFFICSTLLSYYYRNNRCFNETVNKEKDKKRRTRRAD